MLILSNTRQLKRRWLMLTKRMLLRLQRRRLMRLRPSRKTWSSIGSKLLLLWKLLLLLLQWHWLRSSRSDGTAWWHQRDRAANLWRIAE